MNFFGVKEPGMLYNDYMATREILQLFFDAIYSEKLTKEYDKQLIKRKNVKWYVGSRIAL